MPQFMILGPVRTMPHDSVDGQAVALPPKERTVLATLLLHAGEAVSFTALAEALWDTEPPLGARNALQTHIKHLRRLLGPDSDRIVTRAPGYLIRVQPGELDLHRFLQLRDQASAAAHEQAWEQAAGLLTEALQLWHGEPLADVTSEKLRRTDASALMELRAEALEARINADLRLGRHDAIVAELHGLVAELPFRERLWEQLMLALYRAVARATHSRPISGHAGHFAPNSAPSPARACSGCTSRSCPQTRS